MSANPACLHAFSEHHNAWKLVLPDHPPEVGNSVSHGSWDKIQLESLMMKDHHQFCMHANLYSSL